MKPKDRLQMPKNQNQDNALHSLNLVEKLYALNQTAILFNILT